MNIKPLRDYKKQDHRGNDPYYQTKEWKTTRLQVVERDKGLCQSCKRLGRIKAAGRYAVVDHIIPRKKGGHDGLDNLELVCKQCHDIKSAKERTH